MPLRPGRRPLPISLLILAVASLGGCGREEGMHRVSGTVRLDGEPIPEGAITFRDPEGQVGGAGGAIEAGRYSFLSSPGRKAVEIIANRDTGKFHTMNPGPERGQNEYPEPLMEQYIPPEYNTRTTLTAEVVEGNNAIDFDLTSKP